MLSFAGRIIQAHRADHGLAPAILTQPHTGAIEPNTNRRNRDRLFRRVIMPVFCLGSGNAADGLRSNLDQGQGQRSTMILP
jgi:hypothetical protein